MRCVLLLFGGCCCRLLLGGVCRVGVVVVYRLVLLSAVKVSWLLVVVCYGLLVAVVV